MTLINPTRQRILRLFQLAEPGRDWEEDPLKEAPGVTVGIRPGEFYSLYGEGYSLLQELCDVLAQPATAGGGRSLDEAKGLLLAACTRYLTEGTDAALDWLESRLSAGLQTWAVIRPTRAITLAPLLVIGRCRIQRGLPPSPFGAWEEFIVEAFPAFSISTDVSAHDYEAAKLAAEENFGETLGIMQIGSRQSAAIIGQETLVIPRSGPIHFGMTAKRAPSLTSMSDDEGALRPHIEPLSAAAKKPDEDRTEWERRTLAAGRWLVKALSTEWPSDALLSLMVALETLFVRDRQTSYKGAVVARELALRWRLRPWTQAEQQEWVEDLYRRRNEIAHEGRSHRNELDVEKLADLAWLAVSWAAWHMNPMHRWQNRPCETWADAFGNHED